MLRAQREYNRVIRCRGLQLKIKRTAEPFAQCQTPSPIEPSAERGVNNQLHPARLIKEAFQHQLVLRWNNAQYPVSRGEIIRQLPSAGVSKAGFGLEPVGENILHRLVLFERHLQLLLHIHAELRDRTRQLSGASRRLAQPKWNAGRVPVGIFHANRAGIDSQNSPGCIAELENITGHALDGEVLIDCSNEGFARFEQHAVIRVVRNRAARSQRH